MPENSSQHLAAAGGKADRKADAIVVGGGLAGVTAALELRAAGHAVLLSQAGWGATANFSGQLALAASPLLAGPLADGAGGVPDGAAHTQPAPAQGEVAGACLAQQVGSIASHEPLHPYALLGPKATLRHLRHGLALLAPVWEALDLALWPQAEGPAADGFGALGQRARAWPAANGTLAPVWSGSCPWTSAPQGAQTVHLDFAWAHVGLGERAPLGWQHDASHFGQALPSVRSLEVPKALLVHRGRSLTGLLALAQAMDDAAFCRALAEGLRAALAGVQEIWLPPVLGLQNPAAARQILQQVWQARVHETLADGPSVAGLRLMAALGAALGRAGVRCVPAAYRVLLRAARAGTQEVSAVELTDGQRLETRGLVLATGRFLGGGLTWPSDARAGAQPLPLAVSTDGGPITERSAAELTRRRPEDDTPLSRAGVLADAGLCPFDPQGRRLTNVRAAGLMLAGFVPHHSYSADGVALATGVAAGQGLHALLSAGKEQA